jgi:hypothetical protein
VKPKARLKQQANSPQQIRQGGDKPLVCLYQQGMHASSNQTLTGEIFAAHGSRLGGYGRTLVMGIVNITPDSFTDGGLFFHPDTAITHARHLVDEGADILDIGGESTRPGAQMVPMEEEWKRVVGWWVVGRWWTEGEADVVVVVGGGEVELGMWRGDGGGRRR